MACVYMLTSPSGKRYIGMTVGTAESRFRSHATSARLREGRMPILHRAIKRYGPEAFTVQTLLIGSREYCAEMESKIIAGYQTLHPVGYNLMNGGEGSGVMTHVSKARKSASLVAAFASPEAKQRISELQKRLWADPEEKAKRSAAIAKAFADPDTKAKLIAAQKRGNSDPTAKARKSEIMKKRMADPEYKRKTVERMLKARGIALA